jgi:hypothetical protein
MHLAVELNNPDHFPVVFDVEEISGQQPVRIGYISMTPLFVPQNSADVAVRSQETTRYPLYLFGSKMVAAHTSRIISIDRIGLVLPPRIAEPNEVFVQELPGNLTQQRQDYFDGPVFEVPAAGAYLVRCVITKIKDTKISASEKIVRIEYPKLSPEQRLAIENSRVIRNIEKKVVEIEQLQKRDNAYNRINSLLLKKIAEYMSDNNLEGQGGDSQTPTGPGQQVPGQNPPRREDRPARQSRKAQMPVE